MTLKEYEEALQTHDWYYEMSDDHSVWRRGQANQAKLVGMSKHSAEHKKLYEEYRVRKTGATQ